MKEKQTASVDLKDNLNQGNESLEAGKEQVKSGIRNKVAMLLLAAVIGLSSCGKTGENKEKDDFGETPDMIKGLTDVQKKQVYEDVKERLNDDYYLDVPQSIKDEILKGLEDGTFDLSKYVQVEDAKNAMLGLARVKQENYTVKSLIDNSSYINKQDTTTQRVITEFWQKVESGDIKGGAEVMFNTLVEMLDDAGVDRFGKR